MPDREFELHDFFPMEIAGGDRYFFAVRGQGKIHVAFNDIKHPPTWKRIVDEAIDYCRDNSIRLSDLAEQGRFKHGEYGLWYDCPESVKYYISTIILQTIKKK